MRLAQEAFSWLWLNPPYDYDDSSWAEWLWDRGFASSETEALHSLGIHAYRCQPDLRQLEEDIGDGVRRGRLTVPDEDELAEAA